MSRLTRTAAACAAAFVAVLGTAAPASAHPLGNFTVNTAAAVVVEPEAVRVDVVVDRAEIPTRQAYPDLDDRSGVLPGGTGAPARAQCDAVAAAAALTVDGRPTALSVAARELVFPEGEAGLRTARLTCGLRTAALPGLVGSTVAFALAPVSPAPGWRETTASGDGVDLAGSTVATTSTTGYLRAYPDELLASPLDVATARAEVVPGTGVATGVGGVLGAEPPTVLPRGADRVTRAFTDLVSRERLTVPFAALAVGVALVLGALHAFAPGHGKTVMAAYLVGGKGSLRDALVIGASVTVTHTLGVLVLGAVLTVVGLASPELAYPVLTAASGVLLVAIGVVLLRVALQRRAHASHHDHSHDHSHDHCHDHSHDHSHDHAHDHRLASAAVAERVLVPAGAPHHDHPHHDHPHPHHDHSDHDDRLGHSGQAAGEPHSHGLFSHTHALPERGSGLKGLLAVGLAGGMVPSPSALVVLLGGIALGRAWFGFGLVVAYGLGMAAALMLTGLLLVRARDRVQALVARAGTSRAARAAVRATAVLPVATAALVLVIGTGVLLRAALLL